jgi:ribonuclease HI/probable phosphoglycerate mutase
VILYCDGASRGNPGPSSIGYLLKDEDGRVIFSEGRILPPGTNNQAEYQALIAGLQAARDRGVRNLLVRADSELMIRQMTGKYRVRNPGLLACYEQATNLSRSFDTIQFEHIPREQNAQADRLANEALDRSGKST